MFITGVGAVLSIRVYADNLIMNCRCKAILQKTDLGNAQTHYMKLGALHAVVQTAPRRPP